MGAEFRAEESYLLRSCSVPGECGNSAMSPQQSVTSLKYNVGYNYCTEKIRNELREDGKRRENPNRRLIRFSSSMMRTEEECSRQDICRYVI